jgi:putative PIN family toxin of toxin-antitoxin system
VRTVLDTNVFVSGVFFGGPPHRILELWRDRRIRLAVSAEILHEYRRVGRRLAVSHPGVDLEPFLTLLAVYADIVRALPLAERVCDDRADDMFLACALAARTRVVVSGDRHLLKVSGYRGVEVVRPRDFLERMRRRRAR